MQGWVQSWEAIGPGWRKLLRPVPLIIVFMIIWRVLKPVERREQASFTELVSWVHQGQVPVVQVKGGVYDFTRVVGGLSAQMETHGPVADEAIIKDLQNNPLEKDGKFKIYSQ
jgi:hypothetical protein